MANIVCNSKEEGKRGKREIRVGKQQEPAKQCLGESGSSKRDSGNRKTAGSEHSMLGGIEMDK